MDQKKNDLDRALATKDLELVRKYVPIPRHVRGFENIENDLTKNVIEKEIKLVEENLASYVIQREATRQKDFEKLQNDKNRQKDLYEAQVKKISSDAERAREKRDAISKWKRAHSAVGLLSPLHQFSELYLPVFLGVIAIGSLIYLIFHFPPPKPLSLPMF